MKISIALVTCGRPGSLLRLLHSLELLQTPAETEIVVVDNDPARSAHSILESYTSRYTFKNIHEPQQGIPYARNAALHACATDSDFIAFLDDDEEVESGWLDAMLAAITATGADATGGPVVPAFPLEAPDWAVKGGFFERRRRAHLAPCHVLATNNCLIRAESWRRKPLWFDTRLRYTGSSDTLFFLEARQQGWQLRWAADAPVREHIPLQRLTADWVIQRQYRIGNGLALCDIIAYGYLRTIPLRLAKALAYASAGFAVPVWTKAGRVRAVARWARAAGTLSALLGYRYEEYAPKRLISEMP